MMISYKKLTIYVKATGKWSSQLLTYKFMTLMKLVAGQSEDFSKQRLNKDFKILKIKNLNFK